MKPPILARLLARLFSDPADRELLLQDLEERFGDVVDDRGARAARRWYWAQALSALPWALRTGGSWRRACSGLLGDLRSGLRTLRRSPLYASGVVGTLALALSAATVTFVVAWNVWLAPMPYPDPDRVVRLYEVEPPDEDAAASDPLDESARRRQLSPPLLEALRARSWRTIESVSGMILGMQWQWLRDGVPQQISSTGMSPEGFEILGLVPTLGRIPRGVEQEALLSERFWRTDFGADPDVIGTDMILADRAEPVVGVARTSSEYLGKVDVFGVIEWEGDDLSDSLRSGRFIDAIARVRPGYTSAQAEAELDAFLESLGEIHPQHRGWSFDAVVLKDDLLRPFREVLALLLAAGATFLLLASVNVAGLVAARRVDGGHDRSIRRALGASERRLLRASLAESLVLAVLGAGTGVLVATGLMGPVRAMAPADVPRLADLTVTPGIALLGLAAGVVLGLLIGLCGYQVSRGRGPAVGRAPGRLRGAVGSRRALVIGQVALTTLLVAAGTAIVHRVNALGSTDLGFEAAGVSTTTVVLTDVRYPSHEARWGLWEAVLEGLRSRGISAAVGMNTPLRGDQGLLSMRRGPADDEIFFQWHVVSEDYFSVMDVALLAGRSFDSSDGPGSARTAVVSEEFVRQYFPDVTALDQVIGRVIGNDDPLIIARTVVGVVESTRHRGADAGVQPDMYSPMVQQSFPLSTLLVEGEPVEVAAAVSEVVGRVDPSLRLPPLMPYESYLSDWSAPFRFQLTTVGALALLGLALAALGLHSLMAYQVATRRNELGVRKAVGARDGALMLRVLGGGAALAVAGTLTGIGLWYYLLPFAADLVEGIESGGPVAPVSAVLLVGGSCILATLLPAFRAARVDPVVTLKSE